MDLLPPETADPSTLRESTKLILQVRTMRMLAERVIGLELVAPDGAPLPAFEAGAHIDVHLPGGLIRQYSLYNDPRESHRYQIAVLRETQGRGGSEAVHTKVRVGDQLKVSLPRNHFALAPRATRHVFVAGGIGITPILAMVAAAKVQQTPFHLYYCSRNVASTAFLDLLQPLLAIGCVTVHHDGGDPRHGLDLQQVLRQHLPGTHLYSCGPGGLLDAVERAAAHWPAEARHSERFAVVSSKTDPQAPPDAAFEVTLARGGSRISVAPGQTIVEALRCQGVDVEVSCCEGYCGTCMTRYLHGKPIHRDSVLDAEDRDEFVMVCCARADPNGGPLVLDL